MKRGQRVWLMLVLLNLALMITCFHIANNPLHIIGNFAGAMIFGLLFIVTEE